MIFLNWKANGTKSLVEEYNGLNIGLHKITALPPIHLASLLDSSKFHLGSQDVSPFSNGAHTGEVTAQMLEEIEIKFCLVGHSERRHYLNEGNKVISSKIKQLTTREITPILCIGESSLDRANGTHFETLKDQMECFTWGCIIAYEPIWAIGTGSTPTNSEIDEVVNWLKQQYSGTFGKPKILYGGSVSAKNIETLSKTKIDGVLVGKSSLDVTEVAEIAKYF